MPFLPVVRRTLGLGTLAGVGLATYAAWEARQYTLRRVTVPLLPAGHAPLKVLHLSDIHMAPDQRAKQEWLRGLADLEPDLVVDTGDNLAHMRAVPVVADALGGLLDVPGVYVLGSNDYYAPGMRNPLLYLLPDTGKRNTSTPQLPWPRLKERFAEAGWLDLTNGFGSLTVRDTTIAFAGVDDPHLAFDDLERVAGPADATADVRLAVAHAPYLRVLDQFAADGYDAIIAGPHPRRPGVPPGRPRPHHELRPRARPRPRPAPPPRRLRSRRRRLVLAPRVGRARHQPVRPLPGRVPSRGHADDPRPRFLSSRRPGLSTRARLWWCGTSEKGVPACPS